MRDELWNRISSELIGIGRKPSAGDRDELAMYGEHYLVTQAINPRFKAKKWSSQWKRASKAAKKLADIMQEIEAEPGQVDLGALEEHGFPKLHYNEVYAFSRRAAYLEQIEKLGPTTPSAAKVADDKFVEVLVRFWRAREGEISRSTTHDSGEASGPLVRFLEANFESVGETKSKESIAHMIRKCMAD